MLEEQRQQQQQV